MNEKLQTVPNVVEPTPRPSITYTYQNRLYINLTSRCPTACSFCIKFSWDYLYRGFNLQLPQEPSVEEVMRAMGDPSQYPEIIFCGYGESTYRLETLKTIAKNIKAKAFVPVRLNTIGLGNLIHGRNIVPELQDHVDTVSVSLNTADPQQYVKLHRPLPAYRERAFESAVEFIRACVQQGLKALVTAIELPEVDVQAVEFLAKQLGADFRPRPYLGEYEAG